MNNPQGRTKILVAHALHFLPQVDYICTIADGRIMERGTYAESTANRGAFSKSVQQFGQSSERKRKKGRPKGTLTRLLHSRIGVTRGRKERWRCRLKCLQDVPRRWKWIHPDTRSLPFALVVTGCPGHGQLPARVLERTTVQLTRRTLCK